MIDSFVQNMKSNIIRNIIDLSGPSLDCGCGDKRYTKLLPEPIGIDNTDGVFEDFVCTPDIIMSAEKLEFENGRFQNVGFYDTLEHLDNPDKAIQEAYRVMKSNGCLSIIDPNDFVLFFARLFAGRFRDAIYGNPDHKWKFNSDDIMFLTKGYFRKEKSYNRLIFTGYKFRRLD